MKSIVIAITGASAMQIAERSIQVLLEYDQSGDLIHIQNIKCLSISWTSIVPPIPSWYSIAKTIEEIIDFIVFRLLDLLIEDLNYIKILNGPFK